MASWGGLGLGLAKFALDNAGQAAELKQNQLNQREQIRWARKSYHTDTQSLLLDALDHSKEEIRSHYETYVARIDTPLLVLALIWPFALNTIQFSDPFVPQSLAECIDQEKDCLEALYPFLVCLWVGFMGIILILPFWGILMLIRCKLKLDSWLESSLAGLKRQRARLFKQREAMETDEPRRPDAQNSFVRQALGPRPKDVDERMVGELVECVFEYQDHLHRIWEAECGWLVNTSTMLLWMSAVAALLLTSISMVIFLYDKGGAHRFTSPYFGVLICSACVLPGVYVLQQKFFNTVKEPVNDDEVFRQPKARSSRDVHRESSTARAAEEDTDTHALDGLLRGLKGFAKHLFERRCRHRVHRSGASEGSEPLLKSSSAAAVLHPGSDAPTRCRTSASQGILEVAPTEEGASATSRGSSAEEVDHFASLPQRTSSISTSSSSAGWSTGSVSKRQATKGFDQYPAESRRVPDNIDHLASIDEDD